MRTLSLGLIAALLLETVRPGVAFAAGNMRGETPGARPDVVLPPSPISVDAPLAPSVPIPGSVISPAATIPSVALPLSSVEAQIPSLAAPAPADPSRQAEALPPPAGEARASPESETAVGNAMFDKIGKQGMMVLGDGGSNTEDAVYLGEIAESWTYTIKLGTTYRDHQKAALHSSLSSVSDIAGQGNAHPAFDSISQDLELRQSLRGLAYDDTIELPLRVAAQRLAWQLEAQIPYAQVRELKLPGIEKDFVKADVYELDADDFVVSAVLVGGAVSAIAASLGFHYLFNSYAPKVVVPLLVAGMGVAGFFAGGFGFQAAADALVRKFNIRIRPSWNEWQALYAKVDRDKAAYKRILLESLKARFASENNAKGLAKLIKKTQKSWKEKAGDLPFEETMAALREAAEAQAQEQRAKLSVRTEKRLADIKRKQKFFAALMLSGYGGALATVASMPDQINSVVWFLPVFMSLFGAFGGQIGLRFSQEEKDQILTARRDPFLDFVKLLESANQEELKKFFAARPAALFLYALRFFQEHDISHGGVAFAPAAKTLLELADDPAYGLTLEQRREIETAFEVAALVEQGRQNNENLKARERADFQEHSQAKRAALLNGFQKK